MSYTLTLHCGCVVYVSQHPGTQVTHTRVIQSRGSDCRVKRHDIGLKLYLWEMLPDPSDRPQSKRADLSHHIRWTA